MTLQYFECQECHLYFFSREGVSGHFCIPGSKENILAEFRGRRPKRGLQ